MTLPDHAGVGDEVIMTVTITNSHPEAIVLDSIDVDDSFLEGFRVVNIVPEPKDTMHVFGRRSWDFTRKVAVADSWDIQFNLKAVSAGHWSGDVDLCNPNQDCTTLIADMGVNDE